MNGYTSAGNSSKIEITVKSCSIPHVHPYQFFLKDEYGCIMCITHFFCGKKNPSPNEVYDSACSQNVIIKNRPHATILVEDREVGRPWRLQLVGDAHRVRNWRLYRPEYQFPHFLIDGNGVSRLIENCAFDEHESRQILSAAEFLTWNGFDFTNPKPRQSREFCLCWDNQNKRNGCPNNSKVKPKGTYC